MGIEVQGLTLKLANKTILNNISFSLPDRECCAIRGLSGSGKTMLAEALCGLRYSGGEKRFSAKPILVKQQHRFTNLQHRNDFYYQQRYNASDADATATAGEILDKFSEKENGLWNREKLYRLLGLEKFLTKPLIQLSNGENKRLQLAEALLLAPDILILDNPFIGLDVQGRAILEQVMESLVDAGVQVLLLSSAEDVPSMFKQTLWLHEGQLLKVRPPESHGYSSVIDSNSIPKPFYEWPTFEYAILLEDVSVAYGEKRILQHINWQVKKGEAACIRGENGAGKSTLLSLLTADNPQAYANRVSVFDKRRGKGESIWQVKQHIGFVSPELHLFFEAGHSLNDVVASGIFDTIGLFRRLDPQVQERVDRWLSFFNLQDKKNLRLNQLSLGEQRLALVIRALVKNPPLLVLDEPFQGMDAIQINRVQQFLKLMKDSFGNTLLYISHYRSEQPSFVSQYLTLSHGKMV